MQNRMTVTDAAGTFLRYESPQNTPWGMAQDRCIIAPGIDRFDTPSHGGYRVEHPRTMPKHLAALGCGIRGRTGPWFEEDCCWAAVALAFPEHFPAKALAHAEDTLRNWHPEAWEAHHGRTLKPGESRARDEQVWQSEHRFRDVVVSAFGGVRDGVPPGFVGVFATTGGLRTDAAFACGKYWLIPDAEYEARGPYGFAIDPARHQPWAREVNVGRLSPASIIAGATPEALPVEETEAGLQTVIPGAEKISDRAHAERIAAKPLRADKPQRPADFGLFGDSHKQKDLF